jgi:hypothetical protein
MRLDFITQPPARLGQILSNLLDSEPPPRTVTFVSAFANRQTLCRLRKSIERIKQSGGRITIVIGIDLDGTSEEALEEILSWQVDARIVKHRRSRNTFHAKIYLIEGANGADILVGSNNLTDGGLFTNYEGALRVTYDLPAEHLAYAEARTSLGPLLDPRPPRALPLTGAIIRSLVRSGLVLAQRDIQRSRRKNEARRAGSFERAQDIPFSEEPIPGPPPLPPDLLEVLIPQVKGERRRRKRELPRGRKVVIQSSAEVFPEAFYMEVNKLQGPRIPGEARIPMEARDLAESFWGWPEMYRRESRAQGMKTRYYWNWRPRWRIIDAANPAQAFEDVVRMYEYEDSSDFRFYSSRLVELGADQGDIVRITRVNEPSVQYEVTLARRGSPEHANWASNCTRQVQNSGRHYGYA